MLDLVCFLTLWFLGVCLNIHRELVKANENVGE